MKNQNRLDNLNKDRVYYLACCVFVGIIAFLFAFPLYWILTGAFKSGADINAKTEAGKSPIDCIGGDKKAANELYLLLKGVTAPATE